MSRAGHPGSGPEIRDLMSRTARELRSRSRMSGRGPGCLARRIQILFGAEIFELGAEIDDSKVKIGEISWMEGGETWGDARSPRNQANPWIKINKTSSNQQITKQIWGLFLVGISN